MLALAVCEAMLFMSACSTLDLHKALRTIYICKPSRVLRPMNMARKKAAVYPRIGHLALWVTLITIGLAATSLATAGGGHINTTRPEFLRGFSRPQWSGLFHKHFCVVFPTSSYLSAQSAHQLLCRDYLGAGCARSHLNLILGAIDGRTGFQRKASSSFDACYECCL
eukprot:scaffold322675_cov20-Prasinocladus_malaysianus.AAC.3